MEIGARVAGISPAPGGVSWAVHAGRTPSWREGRGAGQRIWPWALLGRQRRRTWQAGLRSSEHARTDLVSRWQVQTHFDPDEPAPKKTCGGQGRVSGVAWQDSFCQTRWFAQALSRWQAEGSSAPSQFLQEGVEAMVDELGQPI